MAKELTPLEKYMNCRPYTMEYFIDRHKAAIAFLDRADLEENNKRFIDPESELYKIYEQEEKDLGKLTGLPRYTNRGSKPAWFEYYTMRADLMQ